MNNDNMSDTEEMLQNLFSMGKKIYPRAAGGRPRSLYGFGLSRCGLCPPD